MATIQRPRRIHLGGVRLDVAGEVAGRTRVVIVQVP
jgi:hypothetical protein